MTNQQDQKLWTTDFTIITIGSVVSMLGNAIASFAIGLLVLDITGSTFLYALYMVVYNVPKVVVPILSGPFLDRFSRKRTIYTLDFISATIFLIFTISVYNNLFNYAWIIGGCLVLGTIDSIYGVAYESFYPMLITKGNYSKAYSIASTLQTLTMVMVPVATFLYNKMGIAPVFFLNSISFLIAAIFETRIKAKEEYLETEVSGIEASEYGKMEKQSYRELFMEGITYLRENKGLLTIVIYFMVTMFASGAYEVIALPYFKKNFPDGEYMYIYVMGCMFLGRVLGGSIHYRVKYPVNKKFGIAVMVYIVIAVLEGSFLYYPIKLMMLSTFLCGILGVTSYNIRISATQSYVPDDKKGRFNGIFQMSVMIGMLTGQLLAGVFTAFFPERIVLSGFMLVNFIGVFLIMYKNKAHVKPIYNRQV